MKLTAGSYYRRFEDRAIVKMLHTEVYPYHCSCGALGTECHGNDNAVVMYRLREGEWPTRSEFCLRQEFPTLFEGPLDWDTVLKEFQ